MKPSKMLFGFSVTFVVLAFVLTSQLAGAQSNSVGFVYGRAVSSDGNPLTSVEIVLRNTSTGARRTAATNPEGQFRFASVVLGDYSNRSRGVRRLATEDQDPAVITIVDDSPVNRRRNANWAGNYSEF